MIPFSILDFAPIAKAHPPRRPFAFLQSTTDRAIAQRVANSRMAEPLKEMFNVAHFKRLANAVTAVVPTFKQAAFLKESELDLFFLYKGKRIGVEIKREDVPRMTKSMHVALADLHLSWNAAVCDRTERGMCSVRRIERPRLITAQVADRDAADQQRIR